MRKKFLLVTIALLMTSPVFAWNYNDNEYPYKSITGTKYKYDLSNPGDRIRYGVDPAAQIRDSVNPNVKIDRGLGQYGGGSE